MVTQLEQIDVADLRLQDVFITHALTGSNEVIDVARQECATTIRGSDLHPI